MKINCISVKVGHRTSLGYNFLEDEIFINADLESNDDMDECIKKLQSQAVGHLLSKNVAKGLIERTFNNMKESAGDKTNP